VRTGDLQRLGDGRRRGEVSEPARRVGIPRPSPIPRGVVFARGCRRALGGYAERGSTPLCRRRGGVIPTLTSDVYFRGRPVWAWFRWGEGGAEFSNTRCGGAFFPSLHFAGMDGFLGMPLDSPHHPPGIHLPVPAGLHQGQSGFPVIFRSCPTATRCGMGP